MGRAVTLTAADGFEFDAWHAVPTDARRGGLVICHAVWGVTPHLRDLAESYARDGYEVLVPSLFDRLQRGFADQDTDPALLARQEALARTTGWGAGVMDLVQAAINHLKPPVALLGFCYGGTTAWLASARCTGLSAVASFYGGQIVDYLGETPKVPTILHVGKHDELMPPADVEAIRARHPDLPIYPYNAGHAFVAPSGYHADSAHLSRLRTLALFSRNSGSRAEA